MNIFSRESFHPPTCRPESDLKIDMGYNASRDVLCKDGGDNCEAERIRVCGVTICEKVIACQFQKPAPEVTARRVFDQIVSQE